MKLWIDGDSCHRKSMEIACRAESRDGISVHVMADRDIPAVSEAGVDLIRMEHGSGGVDDALAAAAEPGDVAVTRDLELAMRLLEKGTVVLNDRGRIWNIRDLRRRIEESNLMQAMRAGGMVKKGMPSYGDDSAAAFASALDRILSGS